MVPSAEFGSYYGRPVLKVPAWEPADIAGYFFLGGLAGASSVLGAGAQLTGRPGLARTAKATAATGISAAMVALVHDLGRPARFINMLRVLKVTSPMSVGSWLLSAYVPAAGAAAVTAATRRGRGVGAAATAASAVLGPAIATYTAVLISDTAVPSWHAGYREMPFVFTGSAAAAAGGAGLLGAPLAESEPARYLAVAGSVLEMAAFERMIQRMGLPAEPYSRGLSGIYRNAARALLTAGSAGALLTRRSRLGSALSGAALVAASAATRFSVFHAGVASARDPKYTVVPQRQRGDDGQQRSGHDAGQQYSGH